PEEMDPDVQRQLLEVYSKEGSAISDEDDDDLSAGEQQALLDYYAKRDRNLQGGPEAPAVSIRNDIESVKEQSLDVVIPSVQPRTQHTRSGAERAEDARVARLEAEMATLSAAVRHMTPQVRRKEADKAARKEQRRRRTAKAKAAKASAQRSAVEEMGQYGVHAGDLKSTHHPGQSRPSFEPAAQVEPNSYLGTAFRKLRRHDDGPSGARRQARFVDSGSSSDPSSSDDSDGSDSDKDAKRRARAKAQAKAKAKRSRPAFKPREPEKYNGKADVQTFHKFIQECEAYLDGYDLHESQYAATLSHFLVGNAYSFYAMEVSENPASWDLHRFFRGLFNHCFPVNFRLEQISLLRNCVQGSKSVKAFVHELKTLYLMAGVDSERERVLKLWYGLNPYIQRELWRFQYTPTQSSWAEVEQAAVRFELSAAAARTGPRDGGAGGGTAPDGDPHGGSRGQAGGNPGGRRDKGRSSFKKSGRRDERARGFNKSKTPGPPPPPPRPKQSDSRLPRLSDREREELRAAGKCFVCKEPGHLSRNCPRANVARSQRAGRPPGVRVDAVGLDLNGTEQLRELVGSTLSIDQLAASMVGFPDEGASTDSAAEVTELLGHLNIGDGDGDSADSDVPSFVLDYDQAVRCPPVELPRLSSEGRSYFPVLDLYAEQAGHVLRRHVPYCCSSVAQYQYDEGIETDLHSRLAVARDGEDQYLILGVEPVPDIAVPAAWLRNPDFNLPRWYHRRVSDALGHRACRRRIRGERLDDALAIGLQRQLERDVPYPAAWRDFMGPRMAASRFACYADFERPDVIRIHDAYLFTWSELERSALENPRFDAMNSYAKAIRRAFEDEPFGMADLRGELLRLFGESEPGAVFAPDLPDLVGLQCSAVRVPNAPGVRALQRNSSTVRDFQRRVPDPIVVVVKVNGKPARALIDSGSSADLVSS
ncbi:hypothetical protein PHLGIDRAFT_39631, partial [Phlebiopsis gigantea 11061_1 CR5-6]